VRPASSPDQSLGRLWLCLPCMLDWLKCVDCMYELGKGWDWVIRYFGAGHARSKASLGPFTASKETANRGVDHMATTIRPIWCPARCVRAVLSNGSSECAAAAFTAASPSARLHGRSPLSPATAASPTTTQRRALCHHQWHALTAHRHSERLISAGKATLNPKPAPPPPKKPLAAAAATPAATPQQQQQPTWSSGCAPATGSSASPSMTHRAWTGSSWPSTSSWASRCRT